MPFIPWTSGGPRLVRAFVLVLIVTGGHGAGDAAEPHGRSPRPDSSGEIKKPQIPTDNFEWNGTFRVPGGEKPVITDLTIRGLWQDAYFNLYMQQGFAGGEYWVENLIYRDHLYTITHKWPGVDFPVTGVCYKSHNAITVHDLNGILASAQLVGLEKIDGTPMNHFRASCLSRSQIVIVLNGITVPLTVPIPVSIFSDIYVRPDRSHPFERWLQFGDAVGLSRHHDEWFFFEDQHRYPPEIQLPAQCLWPVLLSQEPCRNLSGEN